MKKLIFIGLVLIMSGCGQRKKIHPEPSASQPSLIKLIDGDMPDPSKPITILVHGTRIPPPFMVALPGLACQIVSPSGLHKAEKLNQFYLFARIASAYAKADPLNFPFENTYLFGWSGTLCFKARKKAARKLYHYLRHIRNDERYKNTPITLITVSHGGNVALNLGSIAQDMNDSTLSIDRLILLCSPIQDATQRFANSALFKSVYHLYSSGEMVQVADPQGMYCNSMMGCKPEKFFSNRIIKEALDHIVQVEIRHKKRTLCHIDFAMPHFSKRLAKVIKLLEDKEKRNLLPKNSDGAVLLDLKDVGL